MLEFILICLKTLDEEDNEKYPDSHIELRRILVTELI
jgi:hypothetical protein